MKHSFMQDTASLLDNYTKNLGMKKVNKCAQSWSTIYWFIIMNQVQQTGKKQHRSDV